MVLINGSAIICCRSIQDNNDSTCSQVTKVYLLYWFLVSYSQQDQISTMATMVEKSKVKCHSKRDKTRAKKNTARTALLCYHFFSITQYHKITQLKKNKKNTTNLLTSDFQRFAIHILK